MFIYQSRRYHLSGVKKIEVRLPSRDARDFTRSRIPRDRIDDSKRRDIDGTVKRLRVKPRGTQPAQPGDRRLDRDDSLHTQASPAFRSANYPTSTPTACASSPLSSGALDNRLPQERTAGIELWVHPQPMIRSDREQIGIERPRGECLASPGVLQVFDQLLFTAGKHVSDVQQRQMMHRQDRMLGIVAR